MSASLECEKQGCSKRRRVYRRYCADHDDLLKTPKRESNSSLQRAVDKARIDELEACLRGVRQAICEQSPVVIWYGPLGITAFDEITSLLGDGESPEVDALINKSGE